MNLEVAGENSAYLSVFSDEEFGEDVLYLEEPKYDIESKNIDNDAYEMKFQNTYDFMWWYGVEGVIERRNLPMNIWCDMDV